MENENKYIPQVGEIVVCRTQDGSIDKSVAIFKEFHLEDKIPNVDVYASRFLKDGEMEETVCVGIKRYNVLPVSNISLPYPNLRPATKDEKEFLLKGIREIGAVWDDENNRFVSNHGE